jgi:hypothetical protein
LLLSRKKCQLTGDERLAANDITTEHGRVTRGNFRMCIENFQHATSVVRREGHRASRTGNVRTMKLRPAQTRLGDDLPRRKRQACVPQLPIQPQGLVVHRRGDWSASHARDDNVLKPQCAPIYSQLDGHGTMGDDRPQFPTSR